MTSLSLIGFVLSIRKIFLWNLYLWIKFKDKIEDRDTEMRWVEQGERKCYERQKQNVVWGERLKCGRQAGDRSPGQPGMNTGVSCLSVIHQLCLESQSRESVPWLFQISLVQYIYFFSLRIYYTTYFLMHTHFFTFFQ